MGACISDLVPNAPIIFAKLRDNTIEITWDAPTKNGDKVDIYYIYFEAAGIPKQFHAVVSTFSRDR